MLSTPPQFRLSPEEIERFVECGYLFVRQCFSPEAAGAILRAALDSKRARLGRAAEELVELGGLVPSDPFTWAGRERIDLFTGDRQPIEQFSPRLWGAVTSLVGEERGITRSHFGELLILKAPSSTSQSKQAELSALPWHIDAPGTETSLERRFDALVLLLLWTDCQAGTGGTLFSPHSLDQVVRALERAPDGMDSCPPGWGWNVTGGIEDAQEVVGRAGDVLITHAFMLHTAQDNRSARLRVVENPTITVAEPLRYYTGLASPSPVERAVVHRLTRPRPEPFDTPRAAAAYLVERHDDYFLPGRAAFEKRVETGERERVAQLDALLTHHVVSSWSAELERTHREPLARVRAAVALVRGLTVNQHQVRGELRESAHDDDFERTTFARLLRGFVSCEGQNHLLGLLLVPFFDAVHLFDALDPATGRSPHALVQVHAAGGSFFADAWARQPCFHVATRKEPGLFGTPELALLYEPEAAPHPELGLLPRAFYEHGEALPALAWPRAPSDEPSFLREPLTPAPATAWRSVMRVRARHVLGRPERIDQAYGALLEPRTLRGTTAELVRALAERDRR